MKEKTLKDELLEEYKIRIELHAHSLPVSPCSEVSPRELVKIYKDKNFDAIVLTNHFFYGNILDKEKEEALSYFLNDYKEACKAGEEYGIKVILGAEIRFNESHNDYLLFGVDYDILSTCYDYIPYTLENFRKKIKLENSLILQAHPNRSGMIEMDASLLDGIEGFNMHPGHNSRIGLSLKYAKENNLDIITCGSDFHHKNVNHEGTAALRTKTLPKDSFELVEILKSGDYIFEIGEKSIVLP
jgi:predicted metal-dependent phosphoesterase TrpH